MTKYSKKEIKVFYNDFIKSGLTVSEFSKKSAISNHWVLA